MAYELEPFGIKVVLVEPGPIRTNFADGMICQEISRSKFSLFTNNPKNGISFNVKNGSFPDLVAKVVLKAVTSENPGLRYLAGKDVETWMEVKGTCLMKSFIK